MNEYSELRIFAFIHTDWDWIKQRPHFVLEELAKGLCNPIRVAFLRSWRRWKLRRNERPDGLDIRPFPYLPLGLGPTALRANALVGSVAGRTWAPRDELPDVVLVTSPVILPLLPSTLARVPVVYDCMDLMGEFQSDPARRAWMVSLEDRLLGRAKAVVCSSDQIATAVSERVPLGTHIRVIRNGFSPTALGKPFAPPKIDRSRGIRLTYFGTISDWFDWDLVRSILHASTDFVLDLYGPSDTPIPRMDRLRWHGPIPHRELARRVRHTDVFLMPFVVTPLIRGVNPVKIYEYLWLGRPVIAPYYDEMRHFGDLIYTYSNHEEAISKIWEAVGQVETIYHSERQKARAFLKGASWARRAEELREVLMQAARSGPQS